MSDKKEEFKDPSRLIVWIKYLLFVQVFMALIAIGSNLMEYQLLTDFQNGVYFSQEMAVADAETNDQRQQIIAISYMALFIVSGFLILKWIYQANQNVRFLGAKNMEFTPGWSIGFYFIPILALWKPYQAMKEIWKASHNPQNWQLEKANLVIGIWWFSWIANSMVGQAVFRMSRRAEEISEIMNVNLISQVSEILSIPLAFVTIYLIKKISNAQLAIRNNNQIQKESARGSEII
ncbi:DUF4328 domain-containing protein [Alteromonas sp. ALT199]|uniref:DUF4328 domain-containing protein n=1 Tax=unclassified Alteromonas TaxID=2614992 RepID=UPI001BEB07E9|nr:DUF4328 domain-containing protein [Alteromonas sp. ALT199]MBT3136343.1 DUF4328 domain-containing protein [Alteromonas sp. ALT199]